MSENEELLDGGLAPEDEIPFGREEDNAPLNTEDPEAGGGDEGGEEPTEPEPEPEPDPEEGEGELEEGEGEPIEPEPEPTEPEVDEGDGEGDGEGETDPEEPEEPGVPPSIDLEGTSVVEIDGDIVLTVTAVGENLYSLEVDHSAEAFLPEFTLYADPTNPFGGDAATDAAALGAQATYQDGVWTLTLMQGGLARQLLDQHSAGKISFYLVVSDQRGLESGNMYDQTYARVDFVPEDEPEEPEPEEPEDEFPFADLTTEELADLIRDEATGRDSALLRAATTEYARREAVPPAWSPKQVRDFLLYGTEPAKTEADVWIYDATRHHRAPRQWSDDELVAWLYDQIPISAQATGLQLKAEIMRRFKLRTADTSQTGIRLAYERTLLDAIILTSDTEPFTEVVLTPAGTVESFVPEDLEFTGLSDTTRTFIVESLQRYLNAVRPGVQISEADGGRAQQELERTFRYVLNLEGQALLTGLNVIMAAIKKHRNDIFSASMAYRFTHLLRGGLKVQQQHINFIELFRVYSDPNTDIRKQVDVRYMVASYPEAIANVLVDYFQNHA